ncbi:hypothetical protein [Pseudarthrobacter sp. WHRI 8279]|uniref:hypothetical protein n=1 Tax=Pseudarthrobacter sp. WHRI 8279 TaxID=3162566 RepID=UPI0035A8C136
MWQSILTNFGVGLISAAVLLLFEPRFRRVVTDTFNTATAGVKAEVQEAYRADLDERLGPLSERIDALYDAKLSEQHALATDLANDFTHDRVSHTLREADKAAALFGRSLRVQAENEPGKLHVSLELRTYYRPDAWFRQQRHGAVEEPDEDLMVVAHTQGGKHSSEVTWEPGADFSTVAIELATELNAKRARRLAQKIDWESVINRFENGIKVALDASHGTAGALNIDGALVEVAGPDSAPWYLTDAGLYYPARDWSLKSASFVTADTGRESGSPSFPDLDKPSWADPKEWEYMISRARSHNDIW